MFGSSERTVSQNMLTGWVTIETNLLTWPSLSPDENLCSESKIEIHKRRLKDVDKGIIKTCLIFPHSVLSHQALKENGGVMLRKRRLHCVPGDQP